MASKAPSLVLSAAIILASCASDNLSNRDLLMIARGQPPEGGQFDGVIGRYNGVPVHMTIGCRERCPEFLGDMIYLDVPGQDCVRHDGVLVEHSSSIGFWAGLKLFCEPKVLVDAAPFENLPRSRYR
jgi:hypothetical protein